VEKQLAQYRRAIEQHLSDAAGGKPFQLTDDYRDRDMAVSGFFFFCKSRSLLFGSVNLDLELCQSSIENWEVKVIDVGSF